MYPHPMWAGVPQPHPPGGRIDENWFSTISQMSTRGDDDAGENCNDDDGDGDGEDGDDDVVKLGQHCGIVRCFTEKYSCRFLFWW